MIKSPAPRDAGTPPQNGPLLGTWVRHCLSHLHEIGSGWNSAMRQNERSSSRSARLSVAGAAGHWRKDWLLARARISACVCVRNPVGVQVRARQNFASLFPRARSHVFPRTP